MCVLIPDPALNILLQYEQVAVVVTVFTLGMLNVTLGGARWV